MQFRRLGRTGIQVSALSFGAGPISTLMIGDDARRQREVISHAIQSGVNWFDTAATYGNGQSETSLGQALAELDARSRVHVATKVRLQGEDVHDIGGAVERSIEASLQRLALPRVTLLQLHNSVTAKRGDEPTSITPADVLGSQGVLRAVERLQSAGLVQHLGLTGMGQPAALREVVASGQFDTMQVPYHLLNPSAGWEYRGRTAQPCYGNIIADCARQDMGVFAIRVLAGGALVGNPPSPHTLKTPFFPLTLYERDAARARRLVEMFGEAESRASLAVRFAVSHPNIHSAIIGWGDVDQIDVALKALQGVPTRLNWDDVLQALEQPSLSPPSPPTS
jgi:aryl-alcohol dehydrogenase-like predicted oxidoreductase